MGSRMANQLLQAGHPVTIYNRTRDKVKPLLEQGATYSTSPYEAASVARIVISMVTDDQGSESVWLDPEKGAILGLGQDHIAIESSTLTVAWVKRLAEKVQDRGAAFLEAPVVGSRPQAEAGRLIYLVGGEGAALDQVQDILRCLGRIQHVGGIGLGMALKLAVNALFGVQVAALAESLQLLTASGFPKELALEYLASLPVISPAAQGAGQLMVKGQDDPLFPIELVTKDMRYALQTAQEINTPAPTFSAIHQLYQQAIDQGYGSKNITAIHNLFTSS